VVIRAGALRHTLTIEEATETRDAHGQAVQTWATFASVPGAFEPLTGREVFAAAQVQAEVTARARIRYLEGVTPKMRISFESKIYAITAVIDRELKHRELELLLSEGLAEG
jgi:SPP1 family predicted phage head-tail adaptor